MAVNPINFRILYLDVHGERKAFRATIQLNAGDTREAVTADIIKNGFRVEIEPEATKGDSAYGASKFARRIAPGQILAVDYEMA